MIRARCGATRARVDDDARDEETRRGNEASTDRSNVSRASTHRRAAHVDVPRDGARDDSVHERARAARRWRRRETDEDDEDARDEDDVPGREGRRGVGAAKRRVRRRA